MSTLRKIAVFALILIVLCAVTNIECAKAYIPCLCSNPKDQCTCFIQLGDKGLAVELIIARLQEQGYLDEVDKKDEFTPKVRQAVCRLQTANGLECTGWIDDDSLNLLLNTKLLNSTVQYTAENWEQICYVPTDGGKKYHSNPKCSGMYNPRMLSRVNAEALGMSMCKKCGRDFSSQEEYSSLGLVPRQLPEEYFSAESAAASGF